MAESIVLQLQSMATDKKHDVSELLRKALVVSTKLKLDEFREWVNHELYGYPADVDVPGYRHIQAEMRVVNPYRGLQPLFMPPDLENELCSVRFNGSIDNVISALKERGNGDRSSPQVPLSPEQKSFLLRHMDLPLEPLRLVSESQLELIADAVRSFILEWSLKLEEQGIVGNGMTFSKEEKEKATTNQQITIASFQGVLGNVSNSTVTQDLQMEVVERDFDSLRRYLESKGVNDPEIDELRDALNEEPKPSGESFGPKVGAWIGKMVGKAASGGLQISVAAAGDLLANAIWAFYGR